MNDELPRSLLSTGETESPTLGMSSLYRLFEAFIALRERNERQHKLFEQSLARARDSLQAGFNSFVGETQKAYQQLRQEVHGDKRLSQVYLNELLEIHLDLARIVEARPAIPDGDDSLVRWFEALEVHHRKVQAALDRFGINRYDAVVGSAYQPALHERVGSRRVDGMDALRIAEQKEPGYASQQPEFVLRRPKVIVTE